MVGAVFLLILAGLIIWAIASAQERARQEDAQREAVERYTSDLGTALSGATETVTEMNLVATLPRGNALEELGTSSETWIENLNTTQGQVVQIFPSRDLTSVNELFGEATSLYISSAQTFALVPEVSGGTRNDVFARAADQRDTATALWTSAIGVLDQIRRDLGLRASGLQAPAPPAPEADLPVGEDGESVEIPIEVEEGEEGEGDGGREDTDEGADENDDGAGNDG